MAKLSRRFMVKGVIDYKNQCIVEYDKDGNEFTHNFEDIFVEFDDLGDVTLTLAYDEEIKGEEE